MADHGCLATAAFAVALSKMEWIKANSARIYVLLSFVGLALAINLLRRAGG